MKKIVLTFVSCLALCACQPTANKENSAKADSDSISAATSNEPKEILPSVEARVKGIFTHICSSYNKCTENNGALSPKENFDSLYCTTQWNTMIAKIREEDEMYFDYDYWCEGQDFENLKFENVKVLSQDGQKATVSLDTYNMGEKTQRTLEMVYERDNWYIGDMISKNEYGETDIMKGIEEALAGSKKRGLTLNDKTRRYPTNG